MNLREEGFSEVFSSCSKLKRQPFNSFRSDKAYAFICPVAEHRYQLDDEAIKIGVEHDRTLFSRYLSVEKPNLGYEGESYVALDTLDCRHMMMSTLCFSERENEIEIKSVTEIGGGYGNWALLNLRSIQGIKSWTIIDLPFVLDLQYWFLTNSLYPQEWYKMHFMNITEQTKETDLLIAAHSLSELSWKDFLGYSDLLSKTKYLFYAFHKSWPHPDLIKDKENFILDHFNVIKSIDTENGSVKNYLLKRK